LLYSNGCLVAGCQTGALAYSSPSRTNNYGESCFVHYPATVGQQFLAVVYPTNAFFAYTTGVFFRILGTTSFTDITGTSINAQIQGNNVQYYQITSANSNGPQSVRISLNITGGPQLLLQAAGSATFLDAQQTGSYSGWYQTKLCPFGLCTIELPTAASHPSVPIIYIWVSTFSTNEPNTFTPEEAPTNYQISGSVGLSNCAAYSAIVGTGVFCSNVSVTTAPNGFWNPRSPSTFNAEAQCLFNSLLCRCPTPTNPCSQQLQRFACLETFHECDPQGFWVSKCVGECTAAVAACGPFRSEPGSSCDCQASQFDCSSSSYATAEPCTGNLGSTSTGGSGSGNTTGTGGSGTGTGTGGSGTGGIGSFGPTPAEPTAPEPSPFPDSDSDDCVQQVGKRVDQNQNLVLNEQNTSNIMTISYYLLFILLFVIFF